MSSVADSTRAAAFSRSASPTATEATALSRSCRGMAFFSASGVSRFVSVRYLAKAALAAANIALAAANLCSNGFLSRANSGSPAFTFVPSVNSTLSTNASTRARTSTFWGESSWPMNSVESGRFVAVTSITCTTGGGKAAGAAFLQPDVIRVSAVASNTKLVEMLAFSPGCSMASQKFHISFHSRNPAGRCAGL